MVWVRCSVRWTEGWLRRSNGYRDLPLNPLPNFPPQRFSHNITLQASRDLAMQSSMSRDAEKLFYLPPEFELPAIGEVVGNDVNYHLRVLFERVMEDSATDSESQEGSNHTSSVDPETLDGALEGSCVFSRFTENRIRSRPRPGDEVHNGSNAARGVQTPIFTFGAYSCGCIAQDVSSHFMKALIPVIPCPLDGTRQHSLKDCRTIPCGRCLPYSRDPFLCYFNRPLHSTAIHGSA
jgi:hypothetical protein